ncbi:MAG: hypothetical protein WA771_05660 [Chthoniobacterales bacterium]
MEISKQEEPLRLAETDVRAIVRLLAEAAAQRGGHTEIKRRLMRGLCKLIEVNAWVWVMTAKMVPGEMPVYVGYQHGGFSDEEMAKFILVQSHPEMARLTEPFARELRAATGLITRSLQQILAVDDFESSPAIELWNACGFHPRCLNSRPLDGGGFAGFALYRRVGRPLLTDREVRIAHIVASEVPWLFAMGWPEDRGGSVPGLAPRCWAVHEMLLQGYSRSRITEHLGTSRHTVDGYVKDIFREVGVRSQAELMARFFLGDRGDR